MPHTSPQPMIFLCNLWCSSSLLSFESQRSCTLLTVGFIFAVNSTACMSLQWEARDTLLPPRPVGKQATGKQVKSKSASPLARPTGHSGKTGLWIPPEATPNGLLWLWHPWSKSGGILDVVLSLTSPPKCSWLPFLVSSPVYPFVCISPTDTRVSTISSLTNDGAAPTSALPAMTIHLLQSSQGFYNINQIMACPCLKANDFLFFFLFLRLKPKLSPLVYMIWPLPTPSSSSTALFFTQSHSLQALSVHKALSTSSPLHICLGPSPGWSTSWQRYLLALLLSKPT